MFHSLIVSYLTKLRISAHQLYVETGRYCNPSIPRENRFCFHCKNIVEDEKHFLLDCPLYKHVRKKYSKLLDTNILTRLLNLYLQKKKPVNILETVLMFVISFQRFDSL